MLFDPPGGPGARDPRFHLYPTLADGSVLIRDHVLRALLIAYIPKTRAELSGGHEARRWYIRRVAAGNTDAPQGRPFRSFAEAARAVRDGSWDLLVSHADRRPVRSRRRRG